MTGRGRDGFAVLTVLLVLLALFALCAPFLMTAGNASRAGAQWSDRARADLALDAARREAGLPLRATHPALDPTPYFDTAEELRVDLALEADAARSVMWDAEVTDLAGLVDLNSASPGVLANLLGLVTHVANPVAGDAGEIEAISGAAFEPSGLVRIDGELIGYAELERGTFRRLSRGLLSELDAGGEPLECGPSPATTHEAGAVVYDQRTWAPVEWRAAAPDEPQRFDTIEGLLAAQPFALAELDTAWIERLEETTTVHGDGRAGPRWSNGTRLASDLAAREDCELSVESARWFNPGTLVRIESGTQRELALVLRSDGVRRITLTRPVRRDWNAYRAVVRPMARRPVNLNTASTEVLLALFENLALAGRNARISGVEADRLVEVVEAERPFDGFSDFVQRVVLPAAGIEPSDGDDVPAPTFEPFLQEADALALHANALNANDARLAFSTMPFSFVTRDAYALELRSTVNAPSGVERLGLVRDEIVEVVPQEPLMELWTRQEDFDLAFRLDRQAPFWATGPENTGRTLDFPASPASRLAAHFGWPDLETGTREQTFPSRENGWAQLEPARSDDEPQHACERHRHFDNDTTHPEGHDLAQGPLAWSSDEAPVLWRGGNTAGDFLEPLSFSGWVRPRSSWRDGDYLLDVASTSAISGESDRVSLLVDDGNLVLRVMDAAADRTDTAAFREVGEARYALAPGDGPGAPLDTWMHVRAAVRGNRPDQIALFVDGRQSRTPGMTRLTAAISDLETRIPVESTEGFPERCAIRIGDEILEVVREGDTAFRARHESTGAFAGQGGRRSRSRMFHVGGGAWLSTDVVADAAHPAGASVQLYGYSAPIATNLTTAGVNLSAPLGRFAVARMTGFTVDGLDELDSITLEANTPNGPITVPVGRGLEISEPESLVLTSADDPEATPQSVEELVMPAFHPAGGYAAIFTARRTFTAQVPGAFNGPQDRTDAGLPMGGVEFIEYSGWSGNQLFVRRRNVQFPNGHGSVERVAFILRYSSNVIQHADLNGHLNSKVFVVPVSIPGDALFDDVPAGAAALTAAASNEPPPKVAQLTRLGLDADQTEWVRYDTALGGQLVRTDPEAMESVLRVLTLDVDPNVTFGTPPPDDDDDVDDPGGSGQHGGGPPPLDGGPLWDHRLGEPDAETVAAPLTRAVSDRLQFRGVFGTESHAHPSGTLVLPTFRVHERTVEDGRPGRGDRAVVVEASPTDPGHPVTLHHVHRPWFHRDRPYYVELQDNGDDFRLMRPLMDEETPGVYYEDSPDGALDQARRFIYVAFEDRFPLAVAATDYLGSSITGEDVREHSRLVLFPSGELPRLADAVSVGGEAGGTRRGVPDVVVDELEFASPEFPRGASLVLAADLTTTAASLTVLDDAYVVARRIRETRALSKLRLPSDGGLLRIGDEVLGYRQVDVGAGRFVLGPDERGLLGTEVATHRAGERVTWLESWTTTTLTDAIPPGAASIPVESLSGFPDEGTVLIDDELIHYTRRRAGSLQMPRASLEPGRDDQQGAGLFRGRYGTAPASHAQGATVILFPFRYWDRWTELADAPELSYFGFSLAQPEAFVESVFWQAQESGHFGPRLGVLQRTDASVPWDADPGLVDGLDLFTNGRPEGLANPVERSTSLVEWRLFVRHAPGSFDPLDGSSHGWKTTPNLTVFGTEYLAPGRRLWSVDR